MEARTVAGRLITGMLVLFVASLLLGQVIGQPVLLSFVETGSMSPTLEPGDGFVAIPAGLAGPVEPGDVIVFDAERLHDGGLVTHRVVEETDDGFITRGDANPFTDQSSSANEPPVQREQVVAVAWQVGGGVVAVPRVGLLVIGIRDLIAGLQTRLAVLLGTRSLLGTQGLAYLLFGFGVLAYVASLLLDDRGEDRGLHRRIRETEMTDRTVVVLALTAVLVATLTASMVVPGGTQQFAFVSSDSDSPGAGVIPKGGTEETTFHVPSNGVLPVVVFLEPTSDGIDVDPRELYVPSQGAANATVTLHAPPKNGYYRRYLIERRYLAIVPQSTIRALYRVHPWAPIVAIDALVGAAFFALAVGLVGLGRARADRRGRDLPLSIRIMRWLR